MTNGRNDRTPRKATGEDSRTRNNRASGPSSRKHPANSNRNKARTGVAPGKVRKRKMSPEKRALYRRRRMVVGVGVIVVLLVAVFCIYSLIRGAAAMHEVMASESAYSITRASNAPLPSATSNVKDCTASDITLKLSADKTTVGVGGTVTFTTEIDYTGTDTGGCFVNGADDSRVLTISSGNQTIYRSDACEATYRPLLMFAGQVDSQTMTWNTVATGDSCVDESELPHVNAGTYSAQLSLIDDPDVTSNTVTISVQ